MVLSMINLGEEKTIIDIRGKESMKHHLRDLGFVQGEKVKIISENEGGLIVAVKDVKIALNKGVASLITVD